MASAALAYAASLAVPAVAMRRFFGLEFIGLTGGISSGKSAVSTHLRERGYAVLDFDVLSREVVQPNHRSGALNKIRAAFGDGVLLPDGTLNREALGKVIFNDRTQRHRLDALMRLPIWSAFFVHVVRLTAAGHREIVLDVPLLFEAKMHLLCNENVVIYVTPEVQKERLMKRDNITEAAAVAKITSQWSLEKKAALADTVIDNNGTRDELHTRLDAWLATRALQRRTWWRQWIPTVPTMIAVAMAAPVLLASTFVVRSML